MGTEVETLLQGSFKKNDTDINKGGNCEHST